MNTTNHEHGSETMNAPADATCTCGRVTDEYEGLQGGRWIFWCPECRDHVEVPTGLAEPPPAATRNGRGKHTRDEWEN